MLVDTNYLFVSVRFKKRQGGGLKLNKIILFVIFLLVAVTAVYFAVFYVMSNVVRPSPVIVDFSNIASAPPEADYVPFATAIGVTLLVVLSALAWYVPIGFGRKETGKRRRPR